ncbi:hypothetical protein DPEC_G00368600 [Dallia pectoralis]|nr:hypothetical protein DPEC_G00368600 [Dallia pectoralis]
MRKVLTNWKMSTCKDDVVIKPNKSVPTGRKRKVTVPDGDNAHKKGKPVKTLEEILKEKAARMSASGLGASDVRGPGNAPDSSKGGTTTFNVEASSKDSTDQFRTRLSDRGLLLHPERTSRGYGKLMSAVPQSCVTTPCTATADLLPLELEFIDTIMNSPQHTQRHWSPVRLVPKGTILDASWRSFTTMGSHQHTKPGHPSGKLPIARSYNHNHKFPQHQIPVRPGSILGPSWLIFIPDPALRPESLVTSFLLSYILDLRQLAQSFIHNHKLTQHLKPQSRPDSSQGFFLYCA